jgi:hypothetical protein
VRPSHEGVTCNLDWFAGEVYLGTNLIEARAAAILTPHLLRHAPVVFLGLFLPCHIPAMKAGKDDWGIDTLPSDHFAESHLDPRSLLQKDEQLKSSLESVGDERLEGARLQAAPYIISKLGARLKAVPFQNSDWRKFFSEPLNRNMLTAFC